MAITIDATKGWARPANGAEWTELLAGTGIGNPDSSWDCTEGSGNLADDIGSVTLTAVTSPIYSQAAAGWAGTGLGFTDGTSDAFRAHTGVGPDPTTTSQAWLVVVNFASNPQAAARAFFGINMTSSTACCRAQLQSTGVIRLNVAGVSVDGAASHPNGDYVFVIRYDRAATLAKLYSDLETLTGTYSAAGVLDANKGVGSAGAPAGMTCFLVAMWSGANAETLDDTAIATIRARIESPPVAVSYVPPVFPDRVPRSPAAARSARRQSLAFVPVVAAPPLAPTFFDAVHPDNVKRSRGPAASSRRQAFAAPVFVPPPSTVPTQPPPSVYPPSVPRSKGPSRSSRRQAYAGPIDKPFIPATAIGAIPAVYPQRPMKLKRTAHLRPAWFGPNRLIADPTIVPIGPAGAATIAMAVESGLRITMSWLTDVLPAINGVEQRRTINRWPRLRFQFSSKLTDAQHRALMSTLAGNAHQAPILLLGLAHEQMTIASAVGVALQVHSLGLCDWAQSGRRVVVASPTGLALDGVVQLASGDTITTTTDLSAIAANGRIMPALQVVLDPEQSMGRHRTNRGEWNMVAFSERPLSVPTAGVGATVNTYEGLPVWDLGIPLTFAQQPMRSGTDLVDLGGRVGAFGSFSTPSWDRALRFDSSKPVDWQWFKAFLDTVRGQYRAFLVPTGRPDLVVASGDASGGTLLVQGPPTANAPDYLASWFPSLAHRRLKLVKADGTAAYRTVSGAIDNGNGTQTLTLSASLAGALARVEFLETCRLKTDDVTVLFEGPRVRCDLAAQVVQR